MWVITSGGASKGCFSISHRIASPTDAPAISTSIICPISETETILHYQAFTHKSCSEETKQAFYQSIRAVLAEDTELTQGSQVNYETGVWGQGELHPVKENGVLWFQEKIRRDLRK